MMLDPTPAILTNHQGALAIESAPVHRVIGTSSYGLPTASMFLALPFHSHAIALHPLGTVTDREGSWVEVRWSERKPDHYTRDLRQPVTIEHDGPVTIDVWTFWPECRYETFVWGGPSDFNVDGSVDVFDFLAFQQAFGDGELSADFDMDGSLTVFDFLAFLGTFDRRRDTDASPR